MTFENWMTQRYSYEYSKGEYRDHDMQAAYTAGFREASDKAATLPHRAMYDAGYEDGVRSSTPYTEGYAKGYSDGVEQQHSQLRLLAEAVLEAHSKHYPQAYHVGCEACRVAREVMEI